MTTTLASYLTTPKHMSSKMTTPFVTRPKGASAEGQGDDIASTDISDDGDDTIDSVKYLFALQQIRQEAHKASQANFKREFRALGTEFRGHATTMVDEMNAYIDKLETDALNMQGAECISTQAFVDAAREWNAQRSMVNEARAIDFSDIRRKEEVNEVSKLIEGTAKRRAHAERRLLRNVKMELGRMWEQEKIVTDAKGLVKRYKKLLRE
ncbi:hypothetical protein BJV78DRAFT_321914 [Lactifluus subvellereus]|nr:hypothetical protein BJV78DRAFT_321914 [Lactifluus subvellereus]